MTGTYTAIDLSKLPAPAVVEPLDFETIYAAMKADLQARLPSFDITLETEPAMILLQVAAYRELLIRQRVNDAGRAVMVAYATGADLDQLGALFGVGRLTITPADPDATPPTAAIMESDDDFRLRITLAPEGYSVAGPQGAYIFHALSADSDVEDASVASPSPGEVVVTILSRTGDGTASSGLVANVGTYLSADTRRPLTDHVTVQGAAIVAYAITATITTFAGPDGGTVVANAQAAASAFAAASAKLGRDITRAAVIDALFVQGVQNVALTSPASDVVISVAQASHCTAITLTNGGVGG